MSGLQFWIEEGNLVGLWYLRCLTLPMMVQL
jgi:hypothetical protein